MRFVYLLIVCVTWLAVVMMVASDDVGRDPRHINSIFANSFRRRSPAVVRRWPVQYYPYYYPVASPFYRMQNRVRILRQPAAAAIAAERPAIQNDLWNFERYEHEHPDHHHIYHS